MIPHPSTYGIRQPLRTTWGSLTLLDVAAIGLLLFTLSRSSNGPHALSGDPREAVPEPIAPSEPSGTEWFPTPVPETAYVVSSEADAALLERLFSSREIPYVAGYPTGNYSVVVASGPLDEITVANLAGAGVRIVVFEPYTRRSGEEH